MNVPFVWSLLLVVAQTISIVDANRITGNLCWSMPCMNGGSCFGSASTYICVCPVNYSGSLCEKRLGICQESPCGNRGLCVETGLFSFECRCYFDYMGPLCEEHVPKNDPSVWSSLIPVHTRVLFDILQEAYRTKTQAKEINDSNNTIDSTTSNLITIDDIVSTTMATPITTMRRQINSVANRNKTNEIQHIISADGIQLEKKFPQVNSSFISDMSTQVSPTIETTEQDDYNNETTLFLDTSSDLMTETTENILTTLLLSTTLENNVTVSVEENQTNYSDTTEQDNTTITLTSNTSFNDDQTTDYTTEMIEDSTLQTSSSIELNEFDQNVTSPTTENSLNFTDSSMANSSEPPMTSISISTNSSDIHHQLLLKLCQQLLSHVLPNATSLSTSAALEAVLSLSSNLPSNNRSVDGFINWIKEQLNSTIRSTTTITATTTTTTTKTTTASSTIISSTISSSLPPLLINDKKIPIISLQRVEMDDVLHQINDNNDGDN